MAFHLLLNGTYHSRTQGFCRDRRPLSLDTLASPVASLFSFLLLNSGESTEIEMTESRGDYAHCITNTMSLLTSRCSSDKKNIQIPRKKEREKNPMWLFQQSLGFLPQRTCQDNGILKGILNIFITVRSYIRKQKKLPCFKTHLVIGATPIFWPSHIINSILMTLKYSPLNKLKRQRKARDSIQHKMLT